MQPEPSSPNAPKLRRRVEREVRERLILGAARELFVRDGWEGFSIEGIADLIDCSRALVYAHYPSKEEILLALAIESKLKRLKLLELTLGFEGRPRERLVAIDLMEGYLAEDDIPVEMLVTSARLRAKTTEERQHNLEALELRLQLVGAGIVREAVGAGDLRLPPHTSPDELYFSLWSSVWGATAIQRSDFPWIAAGIPHPAKTVRRSMLVMLDGFGWRPLSNEWDYRETCRRVQQEVFDQESFQRLLAEEHRPDA
jgi:AcrR family transcriptional regulator